HNGLFLELIESLINKVEVFGLHFASLDIRQDSSIHVRLIEEIVNKTTVLPSNYFSLSEKEKIQALIRVNDLVDTATLEDEVHRDTLEVMAAIREIQSSNGEEGCDRYVISHAETALSVMDVYGLLLMSGWKHGAVKVD